MRLSDKQLDALAEAIAEDAGYVVVNPATLAHFRVTAERYAQIIEENELSEQDAGDQVRGNPDEEFPLIHICEVCGETKTMTPEEAFHDGWDYPPRMAVYGVLSPRTCGGNNCGIQHTLYWRVITHKDEKPYALNDEERVLYERIVGEPESITP